MAGADSVDIVPLHGHNIQQQLFPVRHPSGDGTEVMTVDTLEHQPLSVQQQDPFSDFDTTKTEFLWDNFCDVPLIIQNFKQQGVKIRMLRAPEQRFSHIEFQSHFFSECKRMFSNTDSAIQQRQPQGTCTDPFGGEQQRALTEIITQLCPDGKIQYCTFRLHIEEHIPEYPGKPVKILILKPAAGCPFPDPQRQPVYSGFQIFCQTKIRGRKAVFAVADINPVQPKRETAFHSLERNAYFFSDETFRQNEVTHIIRHRVEKLRHFAGFQLTLAVPGILGVDIGRFIVAFHLNMRRDADFLPAGKIRIR